MATPCNPKSLSSLGIMFTAFIAIPCCHSQESVVLDSKVVSLSLPCFPSTLLLFTLDTDLTVASITTVFKLPTFLHGWEMLLSPCCVWEAPRDAGRQRYLPKFIQNRGLSFSLAGHKPAPSPEDHTSHLLESCLPIFSFLFV